MYKNRDEFKHSKHVTDSYHDNEEHNLREFRV